jgi:hypothetical protein
MTKTNNDNQQIRRQWISQFTSLTGYDEEEIIDSALRIRKLHEYRYNPSSISSLVSYFQSHSSSSSSACFSDDSESSSHCHHYTLPYSDLYCLNPTLLPKKEKDYHFIEKSVSLPSSSAVSSSSTSNGVAVASSISSKVLYPSPSSSSFNYVPTVVSSSSSGCGSSDSLSSETTYEDDEEED